jgi:hypothetical protein
MDTVDECLQGLHTHFLQSTDLIKAISHVRIVQGLQDEMHGVRSWRADFSEKLDNTLTVQRNLHSRVLDDHAHRIGSWICHSHFPRTVRGFRRLNGEN